MMSRGGSEKTSNQNTWYFDTKRRAGVDLKQFITKTLGILILSVKDRVGLKNLSPKHMVF